MFFPIDVSPKPPKPKTKAPKVQELEESAILILKPFTTIPKVFLDNVPVGQTVSRFLIIQNPSNQSVEINITKAPPDERNVSFSWGSALIDSNSECVLEIQWTPKKEGGWRDTLMIEDKKRMKKEVPIIFKSVLPKKTLKKSAAGIKKPTLRIISKAKSPPVKTRKIIKRPSQALPQITITSPSIDFYESSNKENISMTYEEVRRETYNLPCRPILKHVPSPEVSFNDSLEGNTFIVSTEAPKHILKSNDNIMKTPSVQHPRKLHVQFKDLTFSPCQQDSPKIAFSPSAVSTLHKRTENSGVNSDTFDMSPNSSSATFTKGNISSDTYVKGNESAETYVIEKSLKSPVEHSHTVESSVSRWVNSTYQHLSIAGVRTVLEFGPYGEESSQNKQLDMIQEESYLATPLKDNTFTLLSEATISNTRTPSPMRRKKMSPMPIDRSINVPKASAGRESLKLVNTWSKRSLLTSKKVPALNLQKFIDKFNVKNEAGLDETANANAETVSRTLHDPDSFLYEINNPVLLSSVNVDPFMTKFYDLKWVDEQEMMFKKWLNALLTPPEELSTDSEGHNIDVAKLWQECKRKNIQNAPSKEIVSLKYHTKNRLNSLRKSAVELFRTSDISQTLSKVCLLVENNKLSIRLDKNIHLDLGLQREILTLFLSYNPLWLRIGLETVFGQTIPLTSNSDIFGISKFMMDNFFKDEYLLKKHKVILSKEYAVDIKKLVLKKFLMFVFFLDQAKTRKLIAHDPCLFCKNAALKSSRGILLSFARELLSSIGDVTKFLRTYAKYVVVHEQTYIHEYDFAIKCLGTDLRDGVRLTRVMELILLKENLLSQLRVPAINIMQKVHNTKIAFAALNQSGFEILYGIVPKDIVEGHKEKTLSFLWQIIYKFQAPRFMKAAVTLQTWWRSLAIIIKRRTLNKIYQIKVNAATKIQLFYRKYKKANFFDLVLDQYQEYLLYKKQYKAAQKIQSYYKMHKQRQKYLALKKSTIYIQTYYRAYRAMILEKARYVNLKKFTIYIQKLYRANVIARKTREEYLTLKMSVHLVEELYRGKQLTKLIQSKYQELRCTVIFIQRRWRSLQVAKKQRQEFLDMKNAAVVIKVHYRAYKAMKIERKNYLTMKQAAITIQQKFRAYLRSKIIRNNFVKLERSVVVVQTHFRALRLMKETRKSYLMQRQAIVTIQQMYRNYSLTKKVQIEYLLLKKSTIVIQQRFRALQAMKVEQKKYLYIKECVTVIQQRYRSYLVTKKVRKEFLQLKDVTVSMQRRFRALLAMRKERESYVQLKKSVMYVQTRFRANKLMKETRANFLKQRCAILLIQERIRSYLLTKKLQNEYLLLKQSTVAIQRRYRSLVAMREQRDKYLYTRKCIVLIQRTFRSYLLTMKLRLEYLKVRNATVVIQRRFRAFKAMKEEQRNYLQLKKCVTNIQVKYRAHLLMKQTRNTFLAQRNAAIKIQQYYRLRLAMRIDRDSYKKTLEAIVIIQTYLRRYILTKKTRIEFITLKQSVIVLQRRFRANCLMERERLEYIKKRNAAICIQRLFRATLLAKKQREAYLKQKYAVNMVENWYKSVREMKECREKFISYKKATLLIEAHYIHFREFKIVRSKYLKQRESAIIIQSWFRSVKMMEEERERYLSSLKKIRLLQKHFRNIKETRTARAQFLKIRLSVIVIQRWYRGVEMTRVYQEQFKTQLSAIRNIARFSRGYLVRRQYGPMLTKEAIEARRVERKKNVAATKIQAAWKGYLIRRANTPKVEVIRKRIKKVSKEAKPEHTLKWRREQAVALLSRDYTSILQMIRALEDLDYTIRRDKGNCKAMSILLAEQLYILISNSSRSLPEMKAATIAASILISFSKYEESYEYAWQPSNLDSIITILKHCCDKESALFPLLCTLLWTFCHEEKKKICFLVLPNFNKQMAKIKFLVNRMEIMVQRGAHKGQSVFTPLPVYNLPSLIPDWGIEYVDRPRTFKNSVFAFNSLMKILGL